MKTLIGYEKSTGNVSFTQSVTSVENVEYASMIADVPSNRVAIRVKKGEVILDDAQEVKETKEKLKKLNEQIYKIKLELLEDMEC